MKLRLPAAAILTGLMIAEAKSAESSMVHVLALSPGQTTQMPIISDTGAKVSVIISSDYATADCQRLDYGYGKARRSCVGFANVSDGNPFTDYNHSLYGGSMTFEPIDGKILLQVDNFSTAPLTIELEIEPVDRS
ncbi:MAG: hypothetical protein QNI84_09850 [Henriciella sp.]|nr:hypothetical protein [Henriciella sp.]